MLLKLADDPTQDMLLMHGPHVPWDTLAKLASAVPGLQAVRDHVEETVNPFQRYKRHTAPSAKKEISELSSWLTGQGVFEHKNGRHLSQGSQASDYVLAGNKKLANSEWLKDWGERRLRKSKSTNDWSVGAADDGQVMSQDHGMAEMDK
jgi:hypothetical protein